LSAFRPLESSIYRLEKIAFSVGREAEKDFKVPFDNLKHRFFHFIQITFWAGQEAENEFALPYNH